MRLLAVAACVTTVFLPTLSSAQSVYAVSVNTSHIKGLRGTLVFDITSNTPITNRFDVTNFNTDGVTGPPQSRGSFIIGDLAQDLRAAKFTRIQADDFFTELSVEFASFGNSIEFTVNVSETGAFEGRPPDEFSLSLLDAHGNSLGTAANDGTPNLAITITGKRGGLAQISRRAGVDEPWHPLDEQQIVDRSLLEPVSPPIMPLPVIPPERRPFVDFKVTPLWTEDSPGLWKNEAAFEGTLTEFCDRRCATTASCTGGAYGISINDDTFYALDDVGGLKAQVALVGNGVNPLREGAFGRAKIVGVLNNSVLTVHTVSVLTESPR